MKDLKNSFYRTLHLDKETNEILKWYRRNVKNILNESESNKIIKKERERND
jgi:hypothetical protein